MRPPEKNQSGPKYSLPVVSVVFFGAYYFFLWLLIEPQILYHHFEVCRRAPFFLTGWLEELLCRKKYNKMAYYLMSKQLDKFVENLPRFDGFGYESIPRHYQEAIVLYIGMTKKNVDLGGRKMNSDTIKQYNDLNRIGEQFSYDGNAAWRALAPRFGRT